MTSDIITYLQSLTLGSYRVSTELPWEHNGQPLYMSNLKRIYVSAAEYAQTTLYDTLQTLSGTQVRDCVSESVTISVYFVNDAKNLPDNYDSVVSEIMTVRTAPVTAGYTSRTVTVTTEFDSDRLITQVQLNMTRIIS